jgi:hypothetical protein
MHDLEDGDMFRRRQLVKSGEFGKSIINLPDAGDLRSCPTFGLVQRVVLHRLTVPVGAAARSAPRA